jgi:hypothetical protein
MYSILRITNDRRSITFFIIIGALLTLSLPGSGQNLFAGQWNQLNTTGSVPHLKNASVIYVPAGNKMVVYGGRTATGTVSDMIWSLDLSTNQWSQIIPVGGPNPAPRYTQNAYYDAPGDAMIIWSGQGASSALYNDVWFFSFSTNMWNLLWPDGNVPGVPLQRYGTASVYDTSNNRFVTFAGFTSSGRFDDTWFFRTDFPEWFERTFTVHPPKRCLHSAVFAVESRKMVIYGGQDAGPLDDIWSLDLDNFSWGNYTPVLKPPARFWNSMIYTGNGNIVIFGGLGVSAPLADMWKFRMSLGLWESVNQGSTIPAARWGHTGIYIPATDRLIIFGGEGAANYSDTWEFTSASSIGIEPISTNIPEEFSLFQNYPNPFNPTTTIKFRIPLNVKRETSDVKLIVYNVLGHQVAELVNQKLSAGSYKVDFDGSNLPSGVYFYTISTTGFTQTKRMILLK